MDVHVQKDSNYVVILYTDVLLNSWLCFQYSKKG